MDVGISNDSDFIKKSSHIILQGVAKFGEAMDKIMSQIDFDIAEDMKKGDALNELNLCIVRPGLGLAPKYTDILLGRKVNQEVKKVGR